MYHYISNYNMPLEGTCPIPPEFCQINRAVAQYRVSVCWLIFQKIKSEECKVKLNSKLTYCTNCFLNGTLTRTFLITEALSFYIEPISEALYEV
jgi:hypothetical protein